MPELEEWKIPLLHSLLQVRAGEFEIQFDDDEADDEENINFPDEILANICTRWLLIKPSYKLRYTPECRGNDDTFIFITMGLYTQW